MMAVAPCADPSSTRRASGRPAECRSLQVALDRLSHESEHKAERRAGVACWAERARRRVVHLLRRGLWVLRHLICGNQDFAEGFADWVAIAECALGVGKGSFV